MKETRLMINRIMIRWLLVFFLAVIVCSLPGLAQASQNFRLLTFATEGNPRLGATQGDRAMDIVDIHNAVRYLMQEHPQELGRPAYIPADMKTLIFDYVVGYTILNDVTARDLPQGTHPAQGSTIQKGLDTFAPCGPYLTPKKDIPDPNLTIAARLNGEAWDIPNANTRYLTFKIPQIIAYLTQRMTLLPGDIISTGVPAPVVPLRAGDTAEIIIGQLGTLRNRVVAGTITGGMAR